MMHLIRVERAIISSHPRSLLANVYHVELILLLFQNVNGFLWQDISKAEVAPRI